MFTLSSQASLASLQISGACVYSIDLAGILFSVLELLKYISIYVARTLDQAFPVYI